MSTSTPNPRLKRERQLKGWSQSHVAKQIEVPDYYISRWERGDVIPSPYYQQRLCELFAKTAEELGFLLPEKNLAISLSQPVSVEDPSKGEVEVPLLKQNEEILNSEQQSPKSEISTISTVNEPVLPAKDMWGTPTAGLHRRWKRPVSLLLSIIVILVLGSVVAATFILHLGSFNNQNNAFVGILSFSSSSVGQDTTSQGIADQVEIELHLLQQPSAGKRYYAWLIPDQNDPEGSVMLLGILGIEGLTGQLSYHSPQHTDLLTSYSGLLITEQDISPMPQAPSLDQSMWRYQAQVPQVRASGTQYSLLDHVRHLLAAEPELEQHQLPGGLAIWLRRNSEQLVTWAADAQSAEANVQHDRLRQDLFRLLDYLDGLDYVQQDLPGNASALQLIDQRMGGIGLLNIIPGQSTRGYLVHIDDHLRGIVSSPGVSTQQENLAEQILQNTDVINSWLQQARQDILQLLKSFDQPLPASQMQQLLTEISTLVTFAAQGKPNSVASNEQGGAKQVDEQILQLANMQIKPVS